MKTRIIQTRFWDDEFVSECDIYTQHLYIYLLTSQYVNICGMFQLPEAKIKFEAKLTDHQFSQAKSILESSKKVFFFKGWIYIVNARKNNRYEKSDDNKTACNNELDKVPSLVKNYFNQAFDSTVESSVDSNQKQEIRNKKQETKEGFILSKDEIQKLKDKFPYKPVEKEIEKAQDWCLSKGVHYKNYPAFMRNWLRKVPNTNTKKWEPPVNLKGKIKIEKQKQKYNLYKEI